MKRPNQVNLSRLRALMQKCALTADDVARRLDVTTRRVYGWLSVGQITPIPTTKLRLLELLSREDEPVAVPLLSMTPGPTNNRIRKTKKKPRRGKSR